MWPYCILLLLQCWRCSCFATQFTFQPGDKWYSSFFLKQTSCKKHTYEYFSHAIVLTKHQYFNNWTSKQVCVRRWLSCLQLQLRLPMWTEIMWIYDKLSSDSTCLLLFHLISLLPDFLLVPPFLIFVSSVLPPLNLLSLSFGFFQPLQKVFKRLRLTCALDLAARCYGHTHTHTHSHPTCVHA